MQEVPASLSEFAERELRGRGIEVRTGTTLRELHARARDAVRRRGDRRAHRRVDGGRQAQPGGRPARAPLDGEGRVLVDRDDARRRSRAAQRHARRGAPARLGDRRLRRGSRRLPAGQPCPPTAQHAIRQGRLVARNVAATLAGAEARPFRYRTKGVVAELGNNQAVAITLGIRWRGMPAWLIARTYHLLLMPGLGRRLRLLVDWNVALAVRPRRLRARAPGQPDAARATTEARCAWPGSWSRHRQTGVS